MTSYEIKGTPFWVDVERAVLIEQADPENVISFHQMDNRGTHYEAGYNVSEKRLVEEGHLGEMTDVVKIRVPQMSQLDLEGVARKYGMTVAAVTGLSDDEVLYQSPAYKQRAGMGKQPVIRIEGHPFYVSVFSGYLQPHDDFTTPGIRLSDLDDFEGPNGKAWIPYDPEKHEVKEVDFSKVLALPKDWVMVELPYANELDPYGYGRQFGDIELMLRLYPLKMEQVARRVPWEETGIAELIKENKSRLLGKGQRNDHPADQAKPDKKRKGPKR